MDVRCERCRVSYVIHDARVPEAGVKVACTGCGHGFLLRKKVLAVAVPLKTGDGDPTVPITDLASPDGAARTAGEGAERAEWRLRQAAGAVFPFRELSTLQRWIVERKASRDDEVAMAGQDDAWRRLGDVPELASFFALVDQAGRAGESRPEPAPPGPRGSPGAGGPRLGPGPRVPSEADHALPGRPFAPAAAARRLGGPARPGAPRSRRRNRLPAAQGRGRRGAAGHRAPTREAGGRRPRWSRPRPSRSRSSRSRPSRSPRRRARRAGPGTRPGALPRRPRPWPPSGRPGRRPRPPAPKEPARPAPRDEATSALRTALAQAREQRDRGRCEAALDLYGRALAIDGRNATALAGRGACYLDLSRYAQAEAAFEGALETDPRNAEALFGLAETYRYMGRKADAVAVYERFLDVRPTGDDAAAARRLISQLKE